MGFKCRIAAAYKANLIKWCDITEMAKRLGNPLYYEVKQPDEEASRWIHEWFSNGRSTAIPCWKTMEYYRTRESNTQTTTSARRNY
jgi:hypothetical protein